MAACGLVAACGDTAGPPPTYVVRDSSGIEIVESSDAAWGAGGGWEVREIPELDIGLADGPGPYRFHRVSDVRTLPDGRIAVADAGSGQVRLFSPDGEHVRTSGTMGDGPGEFQDIGRLVKVDDGIEVYDPRQRRLTTFDRDGGLIGTRPVPAAGGERPMPIGDVLALDGVRAGLDGSVLAPRRDGVGLARDTAYIFLLPPDPAAPRVVATVPGSWTEYVVFAGQPGVRHQPLTPTPSWGANGRRLYVSSGEAFEILALDRDGRAVAILRRTEAPPPTSDADARLWRDALLAPAPEEQRARMLEMLSAFTMPERLPVYASLVVDSFGHLWANRFAAPGIAPGEEWDVYAPEGFYLGTLRVPSGLRVFEVGDDYLLGTWVDGLGVEHVRRYGLDRESGPPGS